LTRWRPLDEVRCAALGLDLVEPTLEQLREAAHREGERLKLGDERPEALGVLEQRSDLGELRVPVPLARPRLIASSSRSGEPRPAVIARET